MRDLIRNRLNTPFQYKKRSYVDIALLFGRDEKNRPGTYEYAHKPLDIWKIVKTGIYSFGLENFRYPVTYAQILTNRQRSAIISAFNTETLAYEAIH